MDGLTPLEQAEKDKYDKVWTFKGYRVKNHALNVWNDKKERKLFPDKFESVLDIGSGTGRLINELMANGVYARGVDISEVAADPAMRKYVQIAPLRSMVWDRTFDVGICTDVMEHIPEQYVSESIKNIHKYVNWVYYKIANFPSHFQGDLHLSVFPAAWWQKKLEEHGETTYVKSSSTPKHHVFTVKTYNL